MRPDGETRRLRLTVLEPGARTTVEDLGRASVGRFGIPRGGAFDPLALVAANRLVGNPDGAAGLELLLRGAELRNDSSEALAIALTGADFAATRSGGGATHPVRPGEAARLEPGWRLRLGTPNAGLRGWLAVSGGIDVPLVLGGRSTCAAGSFGGLDGRQLRAGDELPIGAPPPRAERPAWLAPEAPRAGKTAFLRVLPGPQLARFRGDALAALEAAPWRVDPASDRRGVRLRCDDAAVREQLAGVAGIPPEGTTLGAIQVTPDGGAIALGPDRPVTGGYAKPACVIDADLGALAQLRPGDAVRFCRIALDEACRMWARVRACLPEAVR
jgi:5-oxoprolinase (ATP-hydrolysing) subunit C